MDFQSAMETFAEAWVAANAGAQVNKRNHIRYSLLFVEFISHRHKNEKKKNIILFELIRLQEIY